MPTYKNFSELLNKKYGKKGTPERDVFEAEAKAFFLTQTKSKPKKSKD